tara:strand:+ start:546 stop:782 length:237 start_codon:yes stop_codon:yes gene_type:complete
MKYLGEKRMTEYDVHELHRELLERDRITSLHANDGVLELRFADGTREIWKRRKGLLGKLLPKYIKVEERNYAKKNIHN